MEREQREKIALFDGSGHVRMRATQRALADRSRWGPGGGSQRQVSGKALGRQIGAGLDGHCPQAAACRVCEAKLVGLAQRLRSTFSEHVGDEPWVMVVMVPSTWQVDRDDLMNCSPEKRLGELAQKLRRAEVAEAVLGFDVTLNRVMNRKKHVAWYWSPHANVLLPSRLLSQATGVAKSFCKPTLYVPRPVYTVPVTDPYVAVNYAVKLDIGAMRQRSQGVQPKGNVCLTSRKERLGQKDFRTYLEWRLGFPATDLVKGLGLTPLRETSGDRSGATCRSVIDSWST